MQYNDFNDLLQVGTGLSLLAYVKRIRQQAIVLFEKLRLKVAARVVKCLKRIGKPDTEAKRSYASRCDKILVYLDSACKILIPLSKASMVLGTIISTIFLGLLCYSTYSGNIVIDPSWELPIVISIPFIIFLPIVILFTYIFVVILLSYICYYLTTLLFMILMANFDDDDDQGKPNMPDSNVDFLRDRKPTP